MTGSEKVIGITDMPWTAVRGVRTEETPLLTWTGDVSAMMADPAGGGMRRLADTRVSGVASDPGVRHQTASIAGDVTVKSC